MTHYAHTQTGHAIIWPVLAIIVIANAGLLGHHPPTTIISVILLVCVLLFYRLKITIEDQVLCATFGVGVIRKKVRLAEIVCCEPVRIRWWYGWGIHLTPFGWLYNVSGFDAVLIRLHSGKTVALGTDDPLGLTAAIRGSIIPA